MADLSIEFAGIKSPNPFWIASGPPSNTAYQAHRAFEAGWGGVVWKTIGEPIVNSCSCNRRRRAVTTSWAVVFVGDASAGSAPALATLEDACSSHGWTLGSLQICDLTGSAANHAGEPEASVFHPSEIELGETTRDLTEVATVLSWDRAASGIEAR